MPAKPKIILYANLGENEKSEVDRRIVEMKTVTFPSPLKDIIDAIKSEMGVVIKQYHIYQALKKAPSAAIAPPHEPEEIQTPVEEEKPFSIQELRDSIDWTARKIKFRTSDASCLFYLVRLTESKKYGTKRSEKLDEDLEVCLTASYDYADNLLFPAGKTFDGKGKLTKKEIESGATEKIIEKSYPPGIRKGFIYVDSEGDVIVSKDIKEVDLEGKPVEKYPSSLFLKDSPNEIELRQTINLDEALDLSTTSNYVLFPVENENDSAIKDLIFDLENEDSPKFLCFKFNFYASSTPYDAFLQIIEENNKDYLMMSVGVRLEPQFVGQEEFPEEMVDIDDDFDLDLNI